MKFLFTLLSAIVAMLFAGIPADAGFVVFNGGNFSGNQFELKFGTSKQKTNDHLLGQLENYDFGFVRVGQSDSRSMNLTNNGTEDFQIASITTRNTSSAFSVQTNPLLPAIVKSGGKVNVVISFNPTTVEKFNDTLDIKFVDPVNYTYSICLTGASLTYNVVWVPDLNGNVSSSQFMIPINIKFLDNFTYTGALSYTLKIRFNSELFYPTGVTNGEITSNEIVNGKRIITIEDKNYIISAKDETLTQIKGMVLLGPTDFTSLEIISFNWDTDWLVPMTKSGSLIAGGVCQNDLNRIILANIPTYHVNPNPSTGNFSLEFASASDGIYHVTIYTNDGDKCFEEMIDNKSDKITIPVDFSDKSSGIYRAFIQTPDGIHCIPVRIIK